MMGEQCRGSVSFGGADAQCWRQGGDCADNNHEARVTGVFSALDTWYPERGATEVIIRWNGPVRSMPPAGSSLRDIR